MAAPQQEQPYRPLVADLKALLASTLTQGAAGLTALLGGTALKPNDPKLLAHLNAMSKMNKVPVRLSKPGVGPYFMPGLFKEKTHISFNPKIWHAGVLAHEIGHSQQRIGKPTVYARGLAGWPASLVGAAPLFTTDEDVGRNTALASTALWAPTLYNEADASMRGYKLMRSLGQGRGSAIRAAIGLPTYAAAAFAPLITHAVKKRYGGYDPAKTNANQVKKAGTLYDWDGTLIPKIDGNASKYRKALKKLKRHDVSPLGNSLRSKKVDIATARPAIFHADIRAAAKRLGLNIGEIHSTGFDKTETIRKLNRPLVDNNEDVVSKIHAALGPSFARLVPTHTRSVTKSAHFTKSAKKVTVQELRDEHRRRFPHCYDMSLIPEWQKKVIADTNAYFEAKRASGVNETEQQDIADEAAYKRALKRWKGLYERRPDLLARDKALGKGWALDTPAPQNDPVYDEVLAKATKQASLPGIVRQALSSGDKTLLSRLAAAGGKASAKARALKAQQKLQAINTHMAHPDTRHVMSWHDQDMASLLKESRFVTRTVCP